MRVAMLALVFAVALPVRAGELDRTAEKDLKLLAGTWAVEALSMEGDDVPKKYLKGVRVTVKGDRYSLDRADGTRPLEWVMTLGVGKSPKQVDLARPGESAPCKVGIYELKGDTLKVAICGVKRKAGRPKSFKPDLSVDVVTFRRVKEAQ